MEVPLPVGLNDETVRLELHPLVDLPNLRPTLHHGAHLVLLHIQNMITKVKHVENGPLLQAVDHQDAGHGETVAEFLFIRQVLVVVGLAQVLVLVHAKQEVERRKQPMKLVRRLHLDRSRCRQFCPPVARDANVGHGLPDVSQTGLEDAPDSRDLLAVQVVGLGQPLKVGVAHVTHFVQQSVQRSFRDVVTCAVHAANRAPPRRVLPVLPPLPRFDPDEGTRPDEAEAIVQVDQVTQVPQEQQSVSDLPEVLEHLRLQVRVLDELPQQSLKYSVATSGLEHVLGELHRR